MPIKKRWLFLIALIPRITYLIQIKGNPFFDNLLLDPLRYDQIALDILSGDLLAGDKVFDFSPLYPYFLSAIYAVFGHNYTIARLIQHLFGTLNCVLIYLIGKKVFNEKVGLIAYLFSTFYGVFFFYEGILETESLILCINSLLILSLLHSRYPLAGLLMGISTITRPNILIILPFLLLWIIVREKVSLKNFRSTKPVISFFLAAFLLILPITLRNYVVEKDLVLITSSGGMNFFIGNNTKATGILTEPDFIRPNPLFEHEDARKKAEQLSGRELKPSEASSFWLKEGAAFILANPLDFLHLLGKKTHYIVNYYEVPDNINYYFFKRFSSLLRMPLWSSRLIIPLGLTGLLLSIITRQKSTLLAIMTGGYILFLLLFFVSSRYRLPLIPFLMVFSAYFLYWSYDCIKERKLIPLLCSFAFFFPLLLFVNKEDDSLRKIFLSHSHQLLSNIYFQERKFEKAIEEVTTAVGLNPENSEAGNNLAWIYADQGENLDEALALAKKAIWKYPRNPDYYDTLGWVYYKKEFLFAALEEIEKGLLLAPENESLLSHKKKIENTQKTRKSLDNQVKP